MSVEAISWALSFNAENVSEKAVLLVLANYADGDGKCFPGQQNIAQQASCSERTVRRVLDGLEEREIIRREERRRKDGSRTSDIIILAKFQQSAKLTGGQSSNRTACQNQPDSLTGRDDTNRPNCPNQPAKLTGLTTFEPSEDTSASKTHEGQGRDFEAIALRRKLVEAAGGKIQPAASLVIGEFYELMNQGVDLETDIIPTMQSVAAKMNTVAGTWSYFIKPIKEAYNRRIEAGKGLSKPKVSTIKPDAEMTPEELRAAWAKRLNFGRMQRQWFPFWGPMPGQPGCTCPPDMLEPKDGQHPNGRPWDIKKIEDAA